MGSISYSQQFKGNPLNWAERTCLLQVLAILLFFWGGGKGSGQKSTCVSKDASALPKAPTPKRHMAPASAPPAGAAAGRRRRRCRRTAAPAPGSLPGGCPDPSQPRTAGRMGNLALLKARGFPNGCLRLPAFWMAGKPNSWLRVPAFWRASIQVKRKDKPPS